jgi:hypothetical protein
MAGVAPRISVAGGALSNRVTLLRETAAHGVMPIGDSAFVFRRGIVRVTTDSLLRRPVGDASARAMVGHANVVYERITVERSRVDSAGSLNVLTRPVVATGADASAGRVMPAANVQRERFFVVRPREDR